MSKNFEILQRSAETELFIPAGLTTPLPVPPPAFAKTRADDEIASLVQRLFLHAGQDEGPRVVSFSGIARDKRSSWICAHAGRALAAQTNDSVCIVDANLWSPQLHVHFSTGNSNGLADALTGEGAIRGFASPLSIGDLWLMPSGRVNSDPSWQVDHCRARFAELREEFGYVLISAPPLTREPEAILMGQLADGIVMIVEANQTRREAARRARERLEHSQVQVLGAVLDERTFPIPDFVYRKL